MDIDFPRHCDFTSPDGGGEGVISHFLQNQVGVPPGAPSVKSQYSGMTMPIGATTETQGFRALGAAAAKQRARGHR
jgi:hypothetical protein